MKKIIVLFWKSNIDGVIYNNHDEFDYSVEKYVEITDYFITLGYSVMLRPIDDTLYLWVDKGRFVQS